MTTHILEVAERMADRIGVIAHGKLIAEGTLDELRLQGRQHNALALPVARASKTPSSRWSPSKPKLKPRDGSTGHAPSGSRGTNPGSPGATGWR